MNYLVYLGLGNHHGAKTVRARREPAQRSFALFQKEWTEKGHVQENYNGMTGDGDYVTSSDKFYDWGPADYMEYLEQARTRK